MGSHSMPPDSPPSSWPPSVGSIEQSGFSGPHQHSNRSASHASGSPPCSRPALYASMHGSGGGGGQHWFAISSHSAGSIAPSRHCQYSSSQGSGGGGKHISRMPSHSAGSIAPSRHC